MCRLGRAKTIDNSIEGGSAMSVPPARLGHRTQLQTVKTNKNGVTVAAVPSASRSSTAWAGYNWVSHSPQVHLRPALLLAHQPPTGPLRLTLLAHQPTRSSSSG